jgi:hypothetical protein
MLHKGFNIEDGVLGVHVLQEPVDKAGNLLVLEVVEPCRRGDEVSSRSISRGQRDVAMA